MEGMRRGANESMNRKAPTIIKQVHETNRSPDCDSRVVLLEERDSLFYLDVFCKLQKISHESAEFPGAKVKVSARRKKSATHQFGNRVALLLVFSQGSAAACQRRLHSQDVGGSRGPIYPGRGTAHLVKSAALSPAPATTMVCGAPLSLGAAPSSAAPPEANASRKVGRFSKDRGPLSKDEES